MKITINDEVLAVLMRAEIEGNQLRLTEQLQRPLYVQANKIIELLGGKWNKKAKAHLFEDEAGDRIQEAMMTHEVIDKKKMYQFFETPNLLADRMASMADIQPGQSVLEPSAGNGSLVLAIKRLPLSAPAFITAVEFDPDRNMLPSMAQVVHYGDFLKCNSNLGKFDRVVMNPPFTKGQDISHVQHAYGMLKAGGRLVSITAPGWTFRKEVKYAAFRNWADSDLCQYEELPQGTFSSSGTEVRTMLLTAIKPK